MKIKSNALLLLLALITFNACRKDLAQDATPSAGNNARTEAIAAAPRSAYVPKFMAYWLPYAGNDDEMALRDIPSSVNVLALFAGGIHPDTGSAALDIGLAVSGPRKDWDKIIDTAHLLQAKGTKVILSLFVNDWTKAPASLDYDAFARAVKKKVLDEWKLDGIDLDIEGNPVNANTYKAVNSLAKYFGPSSGTTAILSAVVYETTGYDVLKNTPGVYDFVATMNYWAVSGGSNQSTFTSIINAGVPAGQVLFGISAEKNFRSTSTPANVQKCVNWNPTQGTKGGIMVFDLGGDYTQGFPITNVITGKPAASGVTFYQDINYGGTASQALAPGNYTLSQLQAKGVANDWASSVKVPAGRKVIMYEHDNFTGASWTLTADTQNFTSLSPNANDQVSSVKIQ